MSAYRVHEHLQCFFRFADKDERVSSIVSKNPGTKVEALSWVYETRNVLVVMASTWKDQRKFMIKDSQGLDVASMNMNREIRWRWSRKHHRCCRRCRRRTGLLLSMMLWLRRLGCFLPPALLLRPHHLYPLNHPSPPIFLYFSHLSPFLSFPIHPPSPCYKLVSRPPSRLLIDLIVFVLLLSPLPHRETITLSNHRDST